MKELKEFANLAGQILHNETKYYIDKEIIRGIFLNTKKNYNLQNIIFRLTIIDSYYSTQMNKRYFGIEDIAEAIWKITVKNENKVSEAFLNFALNLQNKEISSLFNHKNYGIQKNGTKAGRAISLISKYAYYQTGYKFPIYDSLAKKVYPLIMKKYFPPKAQTYNIDSDNILEYIKAINQLKELSAIDNYDKLDNLLWLSGKILAGNFSLIFKEKEKYRAFALKVSNNTNEAKKLVNGKQKKFDFSDRILLYIQENENRLSEIMNSELREFTKFALNLKSGSD